MLNISNCNEQNVELSALVDDIAMEPDEKIILDLLPHITQTAAMLIDMITIIILDVDGKNIVMSTLYTPDGDLVHIISVGKQVCVHI